MNEVPSGNEKDVYEKTDSVDEGNEGDFSVDNRQMDDVEEAANSVGDSIDTGSGGGGGSGTDEENDDQAGDDEDDSDVDDIEEKLLNDGNDEFYDEDIDPHGTNNPNNVDKYSEGDEKESWWDGKEKLIALTVGCCCCICLIIIGVIIGASLGYIGGGDQDDGKDGDDESRSSPRPTLAPQPLPPSMLAPSAKAADTSRPTEIKQSSPTLSPSYHPTLNPTATFAPTKSIPETLGIVPDQDTYVLLDGEDQGEQYGDKNTFLVQNGGETFDNNLQISNSVGLISFPLDDVPSIERLNNNGNNGGKDAVLRLSHFIKNSTYEDELLSSTPSTYTITRLPETKMAVEYFHGYFFRPPEDDADGVMVGPSFTVNPDDNDIDVDITSLLFDYSEKVNSTVPQTQLLLLISNRESMQLDGGDRFYTRETRTPPQLLIDFVGGDAKDVTISNEES